MPEKNSMQEEVARLIRAEADAVANLPVSDAYERCINAIHAAVHEGTGKLIISGMGKAGQMGAYLASLFSSTGTPAVFMHPADGQHGDLGILQAQDILMLISNSSKTREVVEIAALARALTPGIQIILLTGNPSESLAIDAEVVIRTGNPREICPLDLAPTSSTTAMKVIGDVLVTLMMTKIGFTKSEYGKRHHGGYLGQKSRANE